MERNLTKPRNILIATPLKGGISPEYVRSLIQLMFSKNGGSHTFQWISVTGTSVALARNEVEMNS